MKKMYRTAIYCRLSKEDGDKVESNSISGQKAYCEDFISKQKDLKIVREPIVDDGVSGVSFERDGFKELESEVRKGTIDCIVVRDLSRFSRNYIDAGRYLEKIFPSLGVRFIAINDNYDSLKSDPQSDAFVLPFKNLINDTYCKDISVKIRSSLEIKKKNGEFVGAFTPYGYKRDSQSKHKLIIDEEAGEVVKLIFSLFKDGKSIGNIADFLNKRGVLSPMEYKKRSGINFDTVFKTSDNAKWGYNTVKRILVNDVYIGTLTQGKRGTPNYKVRVTKQKNECEWVQVESAHEALVDIHDFVAINEMLKRDMRSKEDNSENTLSGFVFCADCGASMIRKTVPSKGKKYVYYVCSKNKKHKTCSSHSFKLDELEEKSLNAIRDQVGQIIELENAINLIDNLPFQNAKNFSFENQIQTLEDEITKYKNLKLRLYEDLNDDIISKDEYIEFKATYTNIIEDKKTAIIRLEKEFKNTSNFKNQNKAWVMIFKEYENIETLSRRVLLSLVDKIKVYENHAIEIVFKYSDEYLEVINYIKSLNTADIA